MFGYEVMFECGYVVVWDGDKVVMMVKVVGKVKEFEI